MANFEKQNFHVHKKKHKHKSSLQKYVFLISTVPALLPPELTLFRHQSPSTFGFFPCPFIMGRFLNATSNTPEVPNISVEYARDPLSCLILLVNFSTYSRAQQTRPFFSACLEYSHFLYFFSGSSPTTSSAKTLCIFLVLNKYRHML